MNPVTRSVRWTACGLSLLAPLAVPSYAQAQTGSLFNRSSSNVGTQSSNTGQTVYRPTIPVFAQAQPQGNIRDGVKVEPNNSNGAFAPVMNNNANAPTANNFSNGLNNNVMAGVAPGAPSLQSTFTYTPPVSTRTLRLHDIVSIRVEEAGQMLASGNTTSRKTTSFDSVLQDWIRLVGVDTIKPAPQSNGDPRARVNENEVYRGDSTMRLNESLTFNVSAEIADILPNGNLVLSARKKIEANDNRFQASLSGVCRPQDITPDNVILSRNIFDLQIKKEDTGHVRDGYSRGWLSRWYAWFKPF